MPTYQYACTECGHRFEQVQSFSDDALTECPQCTGRLRKVFNAVGVVFKGSGFYRNDSRDSSSKGSSDKSDSSAGGSEKKSDSTGGEKKSDAGGGGEKKSGDKAGAASSGGSSGGASAGSSGKAGSSGGSSAG